MRLLVTRPEPDAARTAASLQHRGHQVLTAPLLRMEVLTDARFGIGPWAGVLVSSANALRAIADHRHREELIALPLLAVGRHTAQAARDIGFENVRSADGDARALAALAIDTFRNATAEVLYLAGEDQAADLSGALRNRGIRARTAVVYAMRRVKAFSEPVIDALAEGRIDGVLHYSRRTADTYLFCAEAAGLRRAALAPVHYCLSREIAEPLKGGGVTVRIALQPEETALLRMIDNT
jgi:uroporphyrinogen-III synthase